MVLDLFIFVDVNSGCGKKNVIEIIFIEIYWLNDFFLVNI